MREREQLMCNHGNKAAVTETRTDKQLMAVETKVYDRVSGMLLLVCFILQSTFFQSGTFPKCSFLSPLSLRLQQGCVSLLSSVGPGQSI